MKGNLVGGVKGLRGDEDGGEGVMWLRGNEDGGEGVMWLAGRVKQWLRRGFGRFSGRIFVCIICK